MSSKDSSQIYGSYSYSDTLKGVYYGPGCVVDALPKLLKEVGAKKALIVTGKSLVTKTDVVKKVEKILSEHNAFGATFHEIGEHTPVAGIRAGVNEVERLGADAIVSIGGGSPIDAAKAIIFYHHEHGQEGAEKRYLPHIAIPTTLSAAEYTITAGYTNDEGHKVGVGCQETGCAGIILDAELTLPTPERLWLSSGMRAVDHAVENLYRPLVPHPLKVLCYAALADLFTYLQQSKIDPSNVEVRQRLQVASWMSLWPLKLEKATAVGISHALGHKLGAAYHIPHGITSCLTLAPVVRMQAEVASPQDKQTLADALFYLHVPSTGSVENDVRKLSAEIDGLVTKLGLKTDLAAYNVPSADVPGIAERALGSREDARYPKVVKLLEGLHPSH